MKIKFKNISNAEEIKAEIDKLSNQISQKQSEINLLKSAIEHYQNLCNHQGRRSGYNEFRGDWHEPCPICGFN